VLVLVSGLCILGTVLLIPAGLVLFGSYESVSKRLESTRQLAELQGATSAGDTLADTKEKMELVAANEALVKPHELIEQVTDLVPAGVSLDELVFTREGDTVAIEISGSSVSRTALLSFSDALKGSGLFTDVVIPIESLARNTDLRFRLMLVLNESAPTQL
jgi:Tfp pilus assembly protein PilN